MLDLIRQPDVQPTRRLNCALARTQAELEAAQRIRFQVFG